MKAPALAIALFALALAACSGNFATGTAAPGGVAPPVNQAPNGMPPPSGGYSPQSAGGPTAGPSAMSTPPEGSSVTYPVADAPHGLQCPQSDGFSCVLRFNLPTPSPSPSPGASPARTATPSPPATASPSPIASPASSSPAPLSPSPSASPSGPHLTIRFAALPKDAPPMVDPNPKAVAEIPLVLLALHTDADVTLHGAAEIDYTLPKEQIPGRGFAVQLFHVVHTRKKTDLRFVGSYNLSTLHGTTLRFAFTPPPLAVKKGEIWLVVLYGDELPSESASPAASAVPSAAPSPSAT